MKKASSPPQKFLRQVSAHLALCGLRHWQSLLLQFVGHYAGLELVVDDDREGPRASVIRLLRDINANGLHPTNGEFSCYLSELPFLDYRVRRARPSLTFEHAEVWQPLEQPLSVWQAGHDIGAWRSPKPIVPHEVIAQDLLRRLHGLDLYAGITRH